jgi:hypothetical protein
MRARSLAIACLPGLAALLEGGRSAASASRQVLAQGVRVSSGQASRVWFFCGLMVVFSGLVALKARRVRQEAQGRATPRALVPLPALVRALLAGPFFAAGASLQWALDNPWWGTLLVAAAMALATHRRPHWICRPRGAGRWLPLTDQEAFEEERSGTRGSWLDGSTTAGRVGLCGVLLGCGAIAYLVSRTSNYGAWLALFDTAALMPIFATGLRRDLPPDAFGSTPALARMARELRKRSDLRVVAWARLPHGGLRFDELRLLCAPRSARAGLVGVEIGLTPIQGGGGRLDCPEILVRVREASPCHRAFASLLSGHRWVPGRRADETVAAVKPLLPTTSMTVALAERLLQCAGAGEVAAQLDAPPTSPAKSAKAEAKSSGNGERTSKAGTRASPFQAM